MNLLKILLLFLSPIYAHTDVEVYIGNPVHFEWQDYGEGYEYMFEALQLKDDGSSRIYTSLWLTENSIDIEIEDESSYRWYVYIKESGKSCYDEYQCQNIETGYFDFYFSQEEIDEPEEPEDPINPIEDEEPIPQEVVDNIEQEKKVVPKEPKKELVVKEEVLGTSTTDIEEEYVPKEGYVEKKESKKEVKATKKKDVKEENSCEYIYNVARESFTFEGCKINKPEVTTSTYYSYNSINVVSSKGTYEDSLKIYIKNRACKNFDILNPKTWFGCDEVETGIDEYDIKLNHEVYFLSNKIISPSSYIFQDKGYEITGTYKNIPTDILFKGYFSLKHRGSWLDQELVSKIPTTFKKIESGSNGIYSFPFSKIVYVNQWHGCTKYQCPHRGIDFAVAKEKIYASGNGTVVAKGYDTYYGECNSGGNYLLVKYDSGHHMSYMHLEKTYAKNGQRVKGGDLLALSGNTGANNCQPLGYHLHYELREKRPQSTHIDPVPYINVDWSLVKTNKSDIFPKRLSGDNPHPKY